MREVGRGEERKGRSDGEVVGVLVCIRRAAATVQMGIVLIAADVDIPLRRGNLVINLYADFEAIVYYFSIYSTTVVNAKLVAVNSEHSKK